MIHSKLFSSKQDTAQIIAGGAAVDLLSRVFLAFSSLYIQVKARNVYLTGTICTILSRFVFLNIFDYTGMLAVTAVMGFFRTWIHVPLPLVFAEHLPTERYVDVDSIEIFNDFPFLFCLQIRIRLRALHVLTRKHNVRHRSIHRMDSGRHEKL